ncbi:PucR family transcriptional regulator ligand-binding domain-containing protein, partial [Streptomyces sp. NPDC050428]|uniref:PucR family transcriptional regulator ligand-binding domain-containing protein n=1 Tax=Streptomyces sp. NPDC050428 TaxID=3155757 RepID=UPI00343882A1
MRLRALLETDALGLRLLGGQDELDRTIRGVMTTDLRDPSRYLSGGELVLTGLAWRRTPEDSEPFVRLLAGAGVAGLAAGEAELGVVPDDLVGACARHRLPLFAVSESVAFASITEYVVRQVSGERAGDLAAVVDRHRRLMTSGPAGGGPEVVLDLLGTDLDMRAWVLSPTGRRIAGEKPLSAAAGAALAAEHLTATRGERRAPYRVALGGTTYSLFPVRGPGGAAGAGDVRESVLSDWLLAVEADAGEWGAPRLDLLQGVTQLIAVERDRRDAARAVRRRLAQEILELVKSAAPPAEIAARLRVAAPVLLPGQGTAPHWQIVVARVDWEGEGDTAGADGTGAVAQSLLEEILVDPAAAGTEPGDRVAVAYAGGEAIALVPMPTPVPVPSGADEGAGAEARPAEARPADAGLQADALLAAVREPLTAGLADDGRLTLGVSAAVHSAEGLRGALEEARHARRVYDQARAPVHRDPAAGAGEVGLRVAREVCPGL